MDWAQVKGEVVEGVVVREDGEDDWDGGDDDDEADADADVDAVEVDIVLESG